MSRELSVEAITASNQLREVVAAYQKPNLPVGPTGLPHVDHGSVCTTRIGDSCFLSSDQREELFDEFNLRLTRAEMHYTIAIERLRLDSLLAKDEDVDWVATLILDAAGSFLVARIASSLSGIRGAAESQLEAMAATARLSGLSQGWAKTAKRLAGVVSAKNVEAGIKSAIGSVKKAAATGLKTPGGASAAGGARKILIQQLSTQSGAAFQAVSMTIRATVTDAEMLAIVRSLDAASHTIEAYEAMLNEKLARFASSGVPEIGRRDAIRMHPLGEGEDAPRLPQETLRDTAVVWVEYAAGRPRELFYEVHDGVRVDEVLHPGGSHYPRDRPPAFGPAKPVTTSSEIGAAVPLEFIDVAIARHTQVWGKQPRTILEKPQWIYLREAFDDAQAARASGRSPPDDGDAWSFQAVVDREQNKLAGGPSAQRSGNAQTKVKP